MNLNIHCDISRKNKTDEFFTSIIQCFLQTYWYSVFLSNIPSTLKYSLKYHCNLPLY